MSEILLIPRQTLGQPPSKHKDACLSPSPISNETHGEGCLKDARARTLQRNPPGIVATPEHFAGGRHQSAGIALRRHRSMWCKADPVILRDQRWTKLSVWCSMTLILEELLSLYPDREPFTVLGPSKPMRLIGSTPDPTYIYIYEDDPYEDPAPVL